MRIHGATVLCRLHLEAPERTDLAFGSDDLLDRFRPERTDHFVFEIRAAFEERRVMLADLLARPLVELFHAGGVALRGGGELK